MEAIDENASHPRTAPAGLVPSSWLAQRMLGRASVKESTFADVATAESLGILARELAAWVIEYGIQELDAAAIKQKAPRGFTQLVSRFVFEAATQAGRAFSGIYYRSRLGDDIDNFALFEGPERFEFDERRQSAIDAGSAELNEAARILGIRLER
jgi:hypothetical protein